MWSLKKPKLRFSFLPPPSVRSYKLSSWSWFPPQTLWTITTPALSTEDTSETFSISNPALGTRQHHGPKKPRQSNPTTWKYVICESREGWEQQVPAGGLRKDQGELELLSPPTTPGSLQVQFKDLNTPNVCVQKSSTNSPFKALPHFLHLQQLLEPKVSHGREVYSSAKSSAASELWASLFLTFLQALIGIFEAGREGLEAHTTSRMKGRNSTLNLYTHTMLCSLAFLIILNILLEVYNKRALG